MKTYKILKGGRDGRNIFLCKNDRLFYFLMLSLASTSALKELISQGYSDRGPPKMQEITIGSFKGKATHRLASSMELWNYAHVPEADRVQQR